MINYSQILTLNYAGTQWALSGEEYSGLNVPQHTHPSQIS
jgi:hypothetical protein